MQQLLEATTAKHLDTMILCSTKYISIMMATPVHRNAESQGSYRTSLQSYHHGLAYCTQTDGL